MPDADPARQLKLIASSDDFVASSSALVETWVSEGAGVETVEPILRFIEEHPAVDFGSPGPLVHFTERFYGFGYEDTLLESIDRRPTALTVWMLNRVINGTKEPLHRRKFVAAMKDVVSHPLANDEVRQRANRFVERAG